MLCLRPVLMLSKGRQNLLQGVHAVDGPPYNTLVKVTQLHFRRRWRWLLWLLLFVLCLLLLFHNFLSCRSANACECCSPVPYTMQWQFPSRLLFLHAELVHVFNSRCISKQALPFYWVKSLYMCIIHQNLLFLQTCKSRKISCNFRLILFNQTSKITYLSDEIFLSYIDTHGGLLYSEDLGQFPIQSTQILTACG